MKLEREQSIELYRTFLMFGICLLHASYLCAVERSRLMYNLLQFVVPTFVFISGYFGAKFSVKKLAKLYGAALYAVIVIWVLSCADDGMIFNLQSAVRTFRGYWFLNGYALLMILAPFLNVVSGGRQGGISGVVILLWIWLGSVPGVASIIPVSKGVCDYSGIMMVGAYLIGRTARVCEFERYATPHRCLLTLVLIIPIIAFVPHCASYASPFSVLFGIALFYLVKQMCCVRCAPILNLIGPSLFSVYLIHTNNVGFSIMRASGRVLTSWDVPDFLIYLVVAAVVFFAGLILDCPRRFLMRVLGR